MSTQEAASLSFTAFLDKMKEPNAADLVRSIKLFIKRFDERNTDYAPNPEADSVLVQDFLQSSEQAFRTHPVWQGSGPEVLEQAMEGLEKYLMSKIWKQTFSTCREDRDRDERYHRLATALSFVQLSTLAGTPPDVVPDASLLSMAEGELLKMDRYKAPKDKLLCLVNVKTLVEEIVGAAAKAGAGFGGADAFFPVFLLVIIRSRPPKLASNIEYIRRFRSSPRLNGQFDFMLCNLESAAMYLDTVDYQHLHISQDEFLARLSEAGIPEAEMELRLRLKDSTNTSHATSNTDDDVSAPEAAAMANLLDMDYTAEGVQANASASSSAIDIPITPPPQTTSSQQILTPMNPDDAPTPILLKPLVENPTMSTSINGTTEGTGTQIVDAKTWAAGLPEAVGGQQGDVIAQMLQEGAPLVLEEEAAGRLQQRNPYIYAHIDELNVGDVGTLLGLYRKLAFCYEALTLQLQRQHQQQPEEEPVLQSSPVAGVMDSDLINLEEETAALKVVGSPVSDHEEDGTAVGEEDTAAA